MTITGMKFSACGGLPFPNFNNAHETAYLSGNPANAAHVRESLAQAQRGELVYCSLDEL